MEVKKFETKKTIAVGISVIKIGGKYDLSIVISQN